MEISIILVRAATAALTAALLSIRATDTFFSTLLCTDKIPYYTRCNSD